jgi:hypothetical protein
MRPYVTVSAEEIIGIFARDSRIRAEKYTTRIAVVCQGKSKIILRRALIAASITAGVLSLRTICTTVVAHLDEPEALAARAAASTITGKSVRMNTNTIEKDTRDMVVNKK